MADQTIIGEITWLPINNVNLNPDWPYRKDIGDLDGLAASMNKPNGLLQPIGVDTSGHLIWGYRRLLAARKLGWEKILARIVDVDGPLTAMNDENQNRQPLSVTELTALMRAIESSEAKKAKNTMTAGKEACGNISTGSGKTRDTVAAQFGISGKTFDAMKKIDNRGTDALKAAVDARIISISDAARVASQPANVQDKAVADVRQGVARTASAAAANGRVVYDDRVIFDLLGKLARALNQRSMVYGASAKYMQVKDAWADLEKTIKAWQKERR